MNNIYIQTLKLGFENPEGISLQKIADQLNIDLIAKTQFVYHYKIWFYENFYNYSLEQVIADRTTPLGRRFRIDTAFLEEFEHLNNSESIIRADAINKYIDYKELERTRESAKQASYFAASSIFIALLAIIIPFIVSPENITIIGKAAIISVLLTIISTIYVGIDIAKAKPDKNSNFWHFTIIISILGIAVSVAVLLLVNKLVENPRLWLKGLVILPVFVFVVAEIIKKFKSRK